MGAGFAQQNLCRDYLTLQQTTRHVVIFDVTDVTVTSTTCFGITNHSEAASL